MMKKCKGCGAVLQSSSKEKEGYIRQEGALCERCFRIRHYNEYQKVMKENHDFLPILEKINQTEDLVVVVVDILNLPKNLNILKDHLHNPMLLVVTKRDVLPRSLHDHYLLSYMDGYQLPFVDKVLISSTKNKNLDELMNKIKKYQTSKNVYVVGFTNAGKSTMINTILKHYSSSTVEITTSMLTSTTLDMIEVPCYKDLTFLDTPGLLEDGNIVDLIDEKLLKKILPKKEIKPRTYQIREAQTIQVESLCNIEVKEPTNITFYLANQLSIERFFKQKSVIYGEEKTIVIDKPNTDVVILGLGFIRVMKPCTLKFDVIKGTTIYTRPSLIGKVGE